jgi:hypothetical protein
MKKEYKDFINRYYPFYLRCINFKLQGLFGIFGIFASCGLYKLKNRNLPPEEKYLADKLWVNNTKSNIAFFTLFYLLNYYFLANIFPPKTYTDVLENNKKKITYFCKEGVITNGDTIKYLIESYTLGLYFSNRELKEKKFSVVCELYKNNNENKERVIFKPSEPVDKEKLEYLLRNYLKRKNILF